MKLKVSRRKEIVEIKEDVNEIKARTIMQKVSGTKNWCFKVF